MKRSIEQNLPSLKILVIGGAGFIGSNLVESLLERGHKVSVFDNFSSREGQLSAVQNKIDIIRGDVMDEAVLSNATKNKDIIFHLAAQKSVDRSIIDPVGSAKENLIGLVNTLHCAVQNKVSRVFFSSTAAVYGYNENFPLKETEAPDCQSPYALEKVVGEQYLKLFYNLYGLEGAALRFFNVYGPRQFSKAPHCGGVTIVMDQFAKHGKAGILGAGTQTRDMIYVGDVVDACIKAMETKNTLKGEVYNVCTGTKITIKYLQEQVAEVMGLTGKVEFETLPFADGNVVHSCGCPSKAKADFDFLAKTSLKTGLEKTWKWMQENPDFYK